MSKDLYYQCTLQQGDTKTVARIPERGATVGKNVEVFDLGGRWDVTGVYDSCEGDILREKQRMDRRSLLSIK